MLGYVLVSLGLWGYWQYTSNTANNQYTIFFYGFISPLFLYAVSAESRRKLVFFMFWIAVGISHLILYQYLKKDVTLNTGKVNIAELYIYTLPLAFLFQLLRIASYKIQGKDLDIISRGGGGKATVVDYVAFFLFMGAIFFLCLN